MKRATTTGRNQNVDSFLSKSDGCLYRYFDWVDLFQVPIPNFNLNGKSKIGSSFGIIASIMFVFIFINYGLFKILDFYNQKDGIIAQSKDIGFFKFDEKCDTITPKNEKTCHENKHANSINLQKQGFAFQVRDFYSNEIKHDPNFVTWEAYIVESDGNPDNEKKINLTVKPCSDEDYKSLYAGYTTK